MEDTVGNSEDDTVGNPQKHNCKDGNRSVKKILIIRFSSIGDIVLTTPVVRCVKNKYKDCQVHFLTKQGNISVLENNPYIDKIHIYNKNMGIYTLIKELKKENFDFLSPKRYLKYVKLIIKKEVLVLIILKNLSLHMYLRQVMHHTGILKAK